MGKGRHSSPSLSNKRAPGGGGEGGGGGGGGGEKMFSRFSSCLGFQL